MFQTPPGSSSVNDNNNNNNNNNNNFISIIQNKKILKISKKNKTIYTIFLY